MRWLRRRKDFDFESISPERKRIAKIFIKHIEEAIDELGSGYTVTLGGKFEKTPITITIEVATREGEMP